MIFFFKIQMVKNERTLLAVETTEQQTEFASLGFTSIITKFPINVKPFYLNKEASLIKLVDI